MLWIFNSPGGSKCKIYTEKLLEIYKKKFSNSSFIDKYIYFLIIKTQYQKRNLQFERFNSLQI